MNKTDYISLTEFMDYVNTSGSAKATVVAQAKRKREEGHAKTNDYWMQLRNAIRSAHANGKTKDDLDEIIERVHEDRRDNYVQAVKGYKKFWGKKRFSWVNPPRRIVSVQGTRVSLNPEVGLEYGEKYYVIKLFIRADGYLDKRHADLILSLMKNKITGVPENTVFSVLDVMRGKLFEFKGDNYKISQLLEAEGASFNILWETL